MLSPDTFRSAFSTGMTYADYLATGNPKQQQDWAAKDAALSLTAPQQALLSSFNRRINLLCLSGIWCGDCSSQCPMLRHIAAANPASIDLRFLDRDEGKEIGIPLMICGGQRVPTAIFLNEDFDFVSVLGDKTLSRLRASAARKLGPSCPLPGAPISADEAAATLQDWVNEFERVHLLLRLSTKLRARHGD